MEKETLLIGEIDFDQNLYLEAEIGKINLKSQLGMCKIEVYSNEGPVPHFHIISKEKKWECCIEIYRPLYFNHGSKQGKLNNRQCKILDDWMKEKHFPYPLTYWETAALSWELNENPMSNIPPAPKKPDYTQLNK
jgi:hypothetical protein